jgi:hypothetical protein
MVKIIIYCMKLNIKEYLNNVRKAQNYLTVFSEMLVFSKCLITQGN